MVLPLDALHMTPLQGVIQLRPSLTYLDKADVGVKKLEVTSDDGGDTTESEGEEAKPVTVRFAKRENIAKAKQKKVGRKKIFTEAMQSAKSAQTWTEVTYHGAETEEADEERRLLFESTEEKEVEFGVSEKSYLDRIFACKGVGELGASAEGTTMTNGNGAGGGGGNNGTSVSLERIRKFPLKKQVREFHRARISSYHG